VTNLHQLTSQSMTSCPTTWRSCQGHRLLWHHFNPMYSKPRALNTEIAHQSDNRSNLGYSEPFFRITESLFRLGELHLQTRVLCHQIQFVWFRSHVACWTQVLAHNTASTHTTWPRLGHRHHLRFNGSECVSTSAHYRLFSDITNIR